MDILPDLVWWLQPLLNTILIFIIMYRNLPGTFMLTPYGFAPIIAALFLLVGDVAVLLLWQ